MTEPSAGQPGDGQPGTGQPRTDSTGGGAPGTDRPGSAREPSVRESIDPPISPSAGMFAAAPREAATQVIAVPVRPFQSNPSAVASASPSFPDPSGPTRAALATDLVTCPECGQMATVDMARRQAEDFCTNCDYPLFWARGTVIAPADQDTGASLRRLPGTVGRAATASLLCPHCGEPNSPLAEICIRCALSMHPVEIPEPAPPPIVEPDPEPEPEPEPEPGFPWWWVVLIAVCVIIIALMIVWAVTRQPV